MTFKPDEIGAFATEIVKDFCAAGLDCATGLDFVADGNSAICFCRDFLVD